MPTPMDGPTAVAPLLVLRVRIPKEHGCLSVVSVVFCEGLCDGPIYRSEESHRLCVLAYVFVCQ